MSPLEKQPVILNTASPLQALKLSFKLGSRRQMWHGYRKWGSERTCQCGKNSPSRWIKVKSMQVLVCIRQSLPLCVPASMSLSTPKGNSDIKTHFFSYIYIFFCRHTIKIFYFPPHFHFHSKTHLLNIPNKRLKKKNHPLLLKAIFVLIWLLVKGKSEICNSQAPVSPSS